MCNWKIHVQMVYEVAATDVLMCHYAVCIDTVLELEH